MNFDAYEARELTGTVLLRDPELMVRWKEASARQAVLARTVNGTNYTIIADAELAAEIRRLHGDELTLYGFNEADSTISLAKAAPRATASDSERGDGGAK